MLRAEVAQVQQDVGRRVAEARVVRGWSQEDFAAKLGVSAKYVQRIEAGRENLSIASLVKLANCLRVPVPALFTPPTTPAPRPGRPAGRSKLKVTQRGCA